jgi:hypothetical protein
LISAFCSSKDSCEGRNIGFHRSDQCRRWRCTSRCVPMRVAAAAGLHRQTHKSKSDEMRTNWRWGSFTAIPVLHPTDCRASGNCKPCCQVSQLDGPVRNYKCSIPDCLPLVTASSFMLWDAIHITVMASEGPFVQGKSLRLSPAFAIICNWVARKWLSRPLAMTKTSATKEQLAFV